MKELKDYIHLYTGCFIDTPYGTCKFLYFKSDLDPKRYNQVVCDRGDYVFAFSIEEVRLMLRPMDSMNKKECNEWNRLNETLFTMAEGANQVMQYAACVKWALSKGFDLFGLHAAGLCVYENEVK